MTPATFMATPWIPVGRPKRKRERITSQSGLSDIPRSKPTTPRPEMRMPNTTRATTPPAITVPMAAPMVPKAGIGPRPAMNTTLRPIFRTVRRIPRRRGVWASPADRKAPPAMKKRSVPTEYRNMVRRYGNASAWTAGAALTRSRRAGESRYPTGAMITTERKTAVRKAW